MNTDKHGFEGFEMGQRVLIRGFKSCLLCVLCASAVMLSGCQTDRITTSDGMPPAAKPRPAPVTPADAQANRMAFFVGQKPEDSNGNGYPDLISVTVLLFSSPHPTAIRQAGSFVFTLYSQGQMSDRSAKPLAVWTREGIAVQQAETVALGGPCYQFQLSLLDSTPGLGTDKLMLDQADLVCRFDPSGGGESVQCDGVRTIQIGKRLAGGATSQ